MVVGRWSGTRILTSVFLRNRKGVVLRTEGRSASRARRSSHAIKRLDHLADPILKPVPRVRRRFSAYLTVVRAYAMRIRPARTAGTGDLDVDGRGRVLTVL